LAHPVRPAKRTPNGWVTVIGFYTAHVALSRLLAGATTTPVWLALSHAPSVAAQADGNVFEHPLFGQHVRFVLGLQAAGLLVGAGQSPVGRGNGMTIIRVPAPAAADYVRAAQDDDRASSAACYRWPSTLWNVRMTS